MNRRTFLGTLAASVGAFALDPEWLLWKPGAKTIFLPSPKHTAKILASTALQRGDVFTIEGVYAVHPITLASVGFPQLFAVTDDVASGHAVDGHFTPPIILDGCYVNTVVEGVMPTRKAHVLAYVRWARA